MPFEDYAREAREIEGEIIRHAIGIGLDWTNAAAVRQLAEEAVRFRPGMNKLDAHNAQQRAKIELFGLAQLMLAVMKESAGSGIHTHGGEVWKIFSRALQQAAGGGDAKI